MAIPRNREILELARSLRQSYREAEKLANQFNAIGLPTDKVRQALVALNDLKAVNAPLNIQFQQLNATLGITQQQFNALTSAQQNFINQSKGSFKDLLSNISQVAFGYQNIIGAVQSFAARGQEAYQLLVGQNVELQGQLLATRASIAATNKVISQGVEVKDPTKAILALEQPVNNAIAELRKGSLDLVGVTSKDLVPIFQIIAGQSSRIGATLSQSSDLTLSFAAALGTLQIPLYQANEEVNSILNGTITYNSRLAKSLGLNNEMVEKWRSQGVLVERVTERLSAFRSGNALAAQTIDGVSSNIQEIIDEITRVAGEPLLDPIVTQLTRLYDFLKANQDQLQTIATTVVNFFLDLGEQLGEAIAILEPTLKTLGEALFDLFSSQASAAGNVLKTLVAIIVDFVKVAKPLLDIVANITSAIASFVSTPTGQILLELIITLKLVSSGYLFLTGVISAAKLAIDAFTVSVALSGGGLTAAIPILGKVAAAFTTFGASVTAAGGGLKGFIAAITATKVAAAAAIPVLTAAIAVALTYRKAQLMGDVNEDQENFRKQIDFSTESALKQATQLKRLNDVKTSTGKLNKEEEEQLKKLRLGANNQIEGLKGLLETVKSVNPESQEQANIQKTQIENLERSIRLLQKYSGEVKTQTQDLPKLGSIYAQLDAQITSALNKFNRPATEDELLTSAKTLLDLYGQQNALGAVDPAKLVAGIKQIRDDERVKFDIRLQAQQTLTKILESETQKRIQIVENETRRIQDLTTDGFIGQFESQRLLTQEKRRQLNLQIEAVKKAIADENALRREQVDQTVGKLNTDIAKAEKRKSEAEKAIAQGKNVAQNQANIRIANEEIAQLNSKKAIAQQSLQIDSETQSANKSKLSKFNSELITANAQLRKAIKEEALKDFTERQTIADAYYENGLISQEKYNELTYGLTRDRLEEELKQLEGSQRKLNEYQQRTGKIDKEAQEELATKRAEISKKLIQAEVKLQDDRIRLLEQKQKEALDLVVKSEAERATTIAQFRLEQPILVAEANRRETESNRQKIQDDLRLEQEKLDQLQAQESVGNEARERDRRAKISASNVRIAQLTTQLINNEIEQRRRAFEVLKEAVEYEISVRQNLTTEAVQGLEKQKQAQDALNQSLQSEKDLIEAKRGLLDSVSNFYTSNLNILKETAVTEIEKDQITESTAEIQLKAARARFEIERDILEINLQQKQAALEIEALNLKQQATQTQGDLLVAQEQQKIVNADPNATEAQKRKAQLDVEALVIKQRGINLQASLLPQKQDALNRQALLEREALDRRIFTEENQALLARANADRSPFEQFRRRKIIRDRIQDRVGIEVGQFNSFDDVRDLGNRIDFDLLQRQKFNPQSLQPNPQAIAQLQSAFAQAFPNLPVSSLVVPGTTTSAIAPTPSEAIGESKMVNVEAVTISNTFNLTKDDIESGKWAEKIVQTTRNDWKETLLQVMQK